MDNENGVWRTINGAHVFIKDGETVEDALRRRQGRFFKDKDTADVTWIDETDDIPEGSESHEVLNKLYEKAHDLPLDEDWLQVKKWTFSMLTESGVDDVRERTVFRDRVRKLWIEHQMEMGERAAERFLSKAHKSPDSFVEETMVAVNRDNYGKSKQEPYDSPKRAAYTLNCQRCAQAFAIRWVHGYDVQAAPTIREWSERKHAFVRGRGDEALSLYVSEMGYLDWALVCFNVNDLETITAFDIAKQMGRTNASTALQYKQINKIVSKAGPGACYIAYVKWKGQDNGAHVFNIVNDGGTVKFIDAQSGRDASRYFESSMIRPGETCLTRVDKARLNGQMMKEVIRYGE